jgi:hypothetical protein
VIGLALVPSQLGSTPFPFGVGLADVLLGQDKQFIQDGLPVRIGYPTGYDTLSQ